MEGKGEEGKREGEEKKKEKKGKRPAARGLVTASGNFFFLARGGGVRTKKNGGKGEKKKGKGGKRESGSATYRALPTYISLLSYRGGDEKEGERGKRKREEKSTEIVGRLNYPLTFFFPFFH